MKVLAQGVAACRALSGDGQVPEWIELLPPGTEVVGRDGRRWRNDRPQVLIEDFRAHAADLPLDWEHSTILRAAQGSTAPAAGWIKELKLRDGGSVWGRVEWTARGRESVQSREYRYISPVIDFEKATNRIIRIRSAALTNQPNLHLVALNQSTQENRMDPEILKTLGLPETATAADIATAVAKLQGELVTARNRAETPSLDKFVPRADYETAINRAKTAEAKNAQIEADAQAKAIDTEIDAALKAGKITPATADYHRASCRQEGGLERFKAFVEASPVIAPETDLNRRQLPGSGAGAAANATVMQVAAMFGNTAEEIKQHNI